MAAHPVLAGLPMHLPMALTAELLARQHASASAGRQQQQLQQQLQQANEEELRQTTQACAIGSYRQKEGSSHLGLRERL